MLPTAGLTVHVTAVFVVPLTVAEYCWVCDVVNVAVVGVTETEIGGFSVIVALALELLFAALAAVTVTDCVLVMLEGAL